jgi:hypothetical protein
VAVVGVAGAGKSTVAAALARPDVTEGTVPPDFVDAAAFLSGGVLTQELALTLSQQLARSVPGFATTRDRFQQALTDEERRQLDSLEREVLGPLRWLGGGEAIRLVIDGLDQLATASSAAVNAALDAMATDPGLSRVRLVRTCRPDTPRPAGASEVRLDVAPDADIRHAANSCCFSFRTASRDCATTGARITVARQPAGTSWTRRPCHRRTFRPGKSTPGGR